jgi:hypothetical protein
LKIAAPARHLIVDGPGRLVTASLESVLARFDNSSLQSKDYSATFMKLHRKSFPSSRGHMSRIHWNFKQPSGSLPSHAAPSPQQGTAPPPAAASDVLPGASAWLGALKLTAFLAVAGFIGKLALQQFLGIELSHWTAPDLSHFAGRWAMDTISLVMDQILGHPLFFGIPVLLLLVPPLLTFYLPRTHSALRLTTYLSVGVATAGLLFVLLWCEMPTAEMNGWPTQNLSVQLDPPRPGMHAARVSDLKATLLVSKMEGVAKQNGTSCHIAVPPTLSRKLKPKFPVQAAIDYLNALYAWSVVFCIAGWLILYLRAPVEEAALIDEIFKGIRIFACVLLLPLVTCMIPYMYGKLIYPTTYPVVILEHNNGNISKQRLLMDDTDKDITVLSTDDSTVTVVHIRLDDIKSMHQYGYKDLFNEILLQCKWAPPSNGQGNAQN